MRIGFFIPEFPSQTHSFFWREIAALTARYGHDARIVSTRLPPRPVHHAWTDEVEADYLFPLGFAAWPRLLPRMAAGLPRLLGEADTRGVLATRMGLSMLAMAHRLDEVVRVRGIDHLHVHSCANAALIAALLNRMTGQSYSLVLHGPITDYGPHQAYKWDRAAFGFVITEKLKGEILADLPELEDRVSVVPMGVDTDAFTPRSVPRADGSWRWFSCARLNRVKGFDTLIAAAARLKTAGWNFTITIAGEDEQGGTGYRREVERIIAEAGLGDVITLLGAVTQERVLAELQDADGFVLASLHEPLGVVYMEAMACSLPTIGTASGGVAELIEDGVSGRLVPASDPDALATAMKDIMDNAQLARQLGSGGRARIVDAFGAGRSADAIAEQLAS